MLSVGVGVGGGHARGRARSRSRLQPPAGINDSTWTGDALLLLLMLLRFDAFVISEFAVSFYFEEAFICSYYSYDT